MPASQAGRHGFESRRPLSKAHGLPRFGRPFASPAGPHRPSVLTQIRVNYVDSVSYHELAHAAIDGVPHALDPHSRFLARAEWEQQSANEREELPDVGVQLEDDEGALALGDTTAAVTELAQAVDLEGRGSGAANVLRRDPSRRQAPR